VLYLLIKTFFSIAVVLPMSCKFCVMFFHVCWAILRIREAHEITVTETIPKIFFPRCFAKTVKEGEYLSVCILNGSLIHLSPPPPPTHE